MLYEAIPPIRRIRRRNGISLVHLTHIRKEPILRGGGRGHLHRIPDHTPLDVGEQVLGGGEGGDGFDGQAEGGEVLPYLGGGGVTLHAGELVEPAQQSLGRAFAEGDLPCGGGFVCVRRAYDQNGTILHAALGLGEADGEITLPARALGLAKEVEGAVTTLGLAGGTDQRAQLDEALGEVSRPGGGDDRGEGSNGGHFGGGGASGGW